MTTVTRGARQRPATGEYGCARPGRKHRSRCSDVALALSDIINNLVAALLGAAAMYVAVRLRQTVRQQALDRAVRLFFGLPGHSIIIHSAILDKSEGLPTYSYPATDTRAARTLAKL